jgi:prevent-host-death family protein
MVKESVTTSELKARCSEIIGRVERMRTPVILTKRGRPVARIVPMEDGERADLFGFAKGSISILGDIVEPVDVSWEAAQ